jgi:hypothetical protein
MKRNLSMLIIILFALSVGAQPIKQEVIASAGGYNVASGISISWTLGETIVPSFSSPDGSIKLFHGFQYIIVITKVEENLVNTVKVSVYPNPGSDYFNIQFNEPTDGEILLFLLDPQGKPVKTGKIESGTLEKQINMQDLPSGIYYLRLTKGKLVNVYKVVKL